MKKMTDIEKLEFCEKKLKMTTINLFSKKITSEKFTELFAKYSNGATYYRRKLNKPDLFCEELTEDIDMNEELVIVNLQDLQD